MPTVVPINCVKPDTHVPIPCLIPGSIVAFAWIGPLAAIVDFTVLLQWTTDIASGDIVIYKQIKGSIPDPTPVETPLNLGGGPKTLPINTDYQFNWFDDHRSGVNSLAYSRLKKSKGRIALFSASPTVPLLYSSSEFATYFIGDPVTDTPDTQQTYAGIAKWNQTDLLTITEGVPAEVFIDELPV